MNVRLHIERLVVHGLSLSAEEEPALQAAIESELSRLLIEGAGQLSMQDAHIVRVQPEPIQLTSTSDGESLGRQIATTVHGGLRR